jgi:hypothetical protein
MKKVILLSILSVLLISGCVEMPEAFKSIFPGAGGPEVKELPPDVIAVENINVIPNPPINTGDQFSVSFEIKNREETKEVPTVTVQLFDYGLCKPELDTSEWVKQADGISYKKEYTQGFAPLQTELVEWLFTAPTTAEIGNLPSKCPIRFKISYNFTSLSRVDVNVISYERLRQIQRAGNVSTFIPTVNVGRGPVKIYFTFGTSLPIRTSTESFESILPVFITIEDKGTGLLSDIQENELYIFYPPQFTVSSPGKFECSDGVCRNNQEIPMIKKKSPPLRISFKMPDESVVPIERTFFISAEMNYTYDITGETEVEIEPLIGI